jgi:hypothetical protein
MIHTPLLFQMMTLQAEALTEIAYVKANRLFTANEQIIAYKIGALTTDKMLID